MFLKTFTDDTSGEIMSTLDHIAPIGINSNKSLVSIFIT